MTNERRSNDAPPSESKRAAGDEARGPKRGPLPDLSRIRPPALTPRPKPGAPAPEPHLAPTRAMPKPPAFRTGPMPQVEGGPITLEDEDEDGAPTSVVEPPAFVEGRAAAGRPTLKSSSGTSAHGALPKWAPPSRPVLPEEASDPTVEVALPSALRGLESLHESTQTEELEPLQAGIDFGGLEADTSTVEGESTQIVAAPDDDFDVDPTRVTHSPFSGPDAPRMVVVAGPMQGRAIEASGERVTLGRGQENTLVLLDAATSRYHIEIKPSPDESGAYILRDLDSANGTFLNGLVTHRARLYDGDVIELGETRVRFEHAPSGARPVERALHAPPPHVAPPPPEPVIESRATAFTARMAIKQRFWKRLCGAAAACLFFATTALALVVVLLSLSPPSDPGPAPEIVALYRDGVDQMRARRWEEARAKFETIAKKTPELDVADHLVRIEREIGAEARLRSARDALERAAYREARAEARTIPTNTVYARDARRIIERAEAMTKKEAAEAE